MSEASAQPAVEAPATVYRPGVDVIVVSYQTPTDLRGFVDSYEASHPDDAYLWIVNVCPRDDDRRVVAQYGHYDHVSFVENVGYNRAVNSVGAQGSREFVAVFNADVELAPFALTELCAALRDHPEWGVVGPRQVDGSGLLTAPGIFGTPDNPQWRCWREPGADGRFSDVRDDCVTVLGSAFVMRRAVWDQLTSCYMFRDVAPTALGPMLPCSHYYGETAAMYHAAVHGWKLAYLGTTTVVHKWHQSSVIGGHGERTRDVDQTYFRRFCDHHGIPRD